MYLIVKDIFHHYPISSLVHHHSISIEKVLGDVDDNKVANEQKCTECDTLKDKINVMNTEKRSLQNLVDELLQNQSKFEDSVMPPVPPY